MKKIFLILVAAMATLFISCEKDKTAEPQLNNLTGKLHGVFSVSTTDKVQFSQGNLQYDTYAKKWQFASQQYEVQGANNVTENGVQDLFTWTTDGWKTDDTWRVLSSQEWNYLINERTNHQNLVKTARIDGTMGLVLLPDNWSLDPLTSTYTLAQWQTLEEAGAVFLPLAGLQLADADAIGAIGVIGAYWSSTSRDQTLAWHIFVIGATNTTQLASSDKQSLLSIRLVTDVE